MTLTVVLVLILALTASCAVLYACYRVAQAVPTLMLLHADAMTNVADAHNSTATACAASLRTVESIHTALSQRLVSAHVDQLAQVAANHGEAAAVMKSATESHREAASASADSSIELRRASDNLNTLLANSNLAEIRQILQRLQTFFCGKNS